MSEPITISIEIRKLGEVAEEEIRAARDAGIDPLEIAETHAILARIIPHMLGQGSEEGQDLADHVERLEVALRLAQARNQDLESALGRIREASESHPECDRYLDSEHMTNIARMPAMSDIDRAELRDGATA